MSQTSVLYDAPGPRARRRAAIGSWVAGVVLLAGAAVVIGRLADQGQFDAELWSPVLNPGDENFQAIWRLLGTGLMRTMTAAVLAIALSLVVGIGLGVIRLLLGRTARMPLIALIELFRGLPVVVVIFFASKVLPEIGVNVGPLPGADGLWYLVIALVAYNSVIVAEIVRAGVASLPRGQREAGLAIGMTERSTMMTVLLPQAVRVMLPALVSQLVVILKDTSLAAVLGIYTELLRQGNLIALNLDNPIQMLFVVAVIFIVINFALSRVAVWVEKRMSRRVDVKPEKGAPEAATAGSAPGQAG